MVGLEEGITVGLSLMVTVLGPFGLGKPALAGDCCGVLVKGCVAREGGFDGVLGFGFIARATWFIC